MMGLTGDHGGLQMGAPWHSALTEWVPHSFGFGISLKNKLRRVSEKPISAVSGTETPQWTLDGKHLITKLRPEDIDISTFISPDTSPRAIKRLGN